MGSCLLTLRVSSPNTQGMTINDAAFGTALHRALLSLCDHLAEQKDVLDQSQAQWQSEVEATAEIAARVEIALGGGIPDRPPLDL